MLRFVCCSGILAPMWLGVQDAYERVGADTSICSATKYSVEYSSCMVSGVVITGKTLLMKMLFPGRIKQFSSSVDGFSSGLAGLGRTGSSVSAGGSACSGSGDW